MQKKSGFTIIELLIVVIIIGVLATMAVPQFAKAVEKTKMGKAQNMITLINKAQAMYYAENDSLTDAQAQLRNYVEAVTIGSDGDWTYDVTFAGTTATQYTITADRVKGNWQTCVITFNSSTGALTAPAACVRQIT